MYMHMRARTLPPALPIRDFLRHDHLVLVAVSSELSVSKAVECGQICLDFLDNGRLLLVIAAARGAMLSRGALLVCQCVAGE